MGIGHEDLPDSAIKQYPEPQTGYFAIGET